MTLANPVMQNLYGGNVVPPVTAHAKASKPLGINTIDDAVSILNLVNIDNEVLNVESLGRDNASLIRLAAEIVKARKSGADILFDNGRIIISRDVFAAIIRSADSTAGDPSQIGKPKLTGQDQAIPDKEKAGSSSESASVKNSIPLFAPPPPVLDMKKRKGRLPGTKVQNTSIAPEVPEDDSVPMLSSSQAYYILVDIVPPGGGKYVLHISERFGGRAEDRAELEKGLEDFWKDYGSEISVNGRHANIIVKPKLIIGDLVNSEVSKKLVFVYVSQSTAEKLSRGSLVACSDRVTLRTSKGGQQIDLYSKQLISLLHSFQTAPSDSGVIQADERGVNTVNNIAEDLETQTEDAPVNPFSKQKKPAFAGRGLPLLFRH